MNPKNASIQAVPRRSFLATASLAVLGAGMKLFAAGSESGDEATAKKIQALKARGWVGYRDFGALGDGKTDDQSAIVATHAFANEHKLPVKADGNDTHYIGGGDAIIEIRTDTDWGTANFVIDDTAVKKRGQHIFTIASTQKSFKPKGITSLQKAQTKVDLTSTGKALVTVTNSNVKRYIRFGANQNSGASQTDIFQIDKDGAVDPRTPILWDFDAITDINVLPMDMEILRVTGGRFTTLANQEESKYNYYGRGIAVRRSNVIVEGLEHRITGEGPNGAPYYGFVSVSACAEVTVRKCLLSGHKIYQTIGSAGKGVSMGTYDVTVDKALNVSFIDCKQINDINDGTKWGIMASNFSKNLVYDGCTFSRFDAHMGVANATIRNSTLGHQGINAIGSGTFLLENSTVLAGSLINLRSDYGSTWQGEFIIRNCKFKPGNGRSMAAHLISGDNNGQHDFGYPCFMPDTITIENLTVEDESHPDDYEGPALFKDFNPKHVDETYVEKYPFTVTREVILKNIKTASGKDLRVSANPFMFRNVKVTRKG